MTQLRDFTKAQKGRIFSFITIALLLLYFVLLFSWNNRIQTDQVPYTDSCIVDGSDFSPVANFCVAGFNGVLNLLNMIFSIIVTWIITTVSLLIWRFTAIHKNSVITELEWKIAKYTWLAFVILSLIGCLVILHFSHLTFCTFLIGLPILLLWLLGVLPLQKHYFNQKNTNAEV